jgi:hypothetical protein
MLLINKLVMRSPRGVTEVRLRFRPPILTEVGSHCACLLDRFRYILLSKQRSEWLLGYVLA